MIPSPLIRTLFGVTWCTQALLLEPHRDNVYRHGHELTSPGLRPTTGARDAHTVAPHGGRTRRARGRVRTERLARMTSAPCPCMTPALCPHVCGPV